MTNNAALGKQAREREKDCACGSSTMLGEEISEKKTKMGTEVLESGLLAPAEETPKHSLWLSDLDLLTLQTYTPTIYYYKPNGDPNFFSPSVLKAALAKALVPFYPLAGRLVLGKDGRHEIDCTGDGALFVVARSEFTLEELGEAVPSEETKRLLVPSTESGKPPCVLIMFQVTFFKCGGVCLGAALHHAAVDGTSGIHFINTWSDIARGMSVAVPPFLDRTVLRTRSLPPVLSEYIVENGSKAHVTPPTAAAPFETTILKMSKDQVELLRNSSEGKRSLSIFKTVAAHVWRCACKARGLAGDQQTRLYMPVDLRSRLIPPLPQGYLGNAFFRVSVVATVEEILSKGIEFGADKIQETLRNSKPSLLEVLESQKKDNGSLTDGSWELKKSEVWVSSWLAMPIFGLDFGYGKPTFMVRASIQFGGLVYIMRSPSGDGGVTLVVGFEPENLPHFKKVLYEDLGGIGL